MSPRGRQSAELVSEIEADLQELVAATPPAKRKRRQQRALTQAQLVSRLLKLVGPARPARSSIKISRGPRGQALIDVLIHAGDEPGLTTVEAVEAKAMEVYNRLCTAYPIAGMNGAGDAEG